MGAFEATKPFIIFALSLEIISVWGFLIATGCSIAFEKRHRLFERLMIIFGVGAMTGALLALTCIAIEMMRHIA